MLLWHSQVTPCYFEDGSHDTNVYLLDEMTYGHSVEGPAIIIDKHRCETRSLSHDCHVICCHGNFLLSVYSTILVEPGCHASITQYGDVRIQVG